MDHPSVLQQIYKYIYDSFGGNEALMSSTVSYLLLVIVFWLTGALFLIADVTGRPKWMLAYKVQTGANVPIDRAKLKKLLKTVLFNNLLLNAVFSYPIYMQQAHVGCSFAVDDTPRWPTIVRDLAICTIIQEIVFYYSHRLFHHRWFYKAVHKKHHQWTAPIGIVALYATPIEYLTGNGLSVFIGPLITRSHITIWWIWYSLAMIVTVIHHSGYHLPFLPSPQFHDYHHLTFEETAELHQCVDAAMLRLIAIWDEIGIVGDQRIARKGVVLLHLRNLLDEMSNEEELLKSRLVENVEKFTADLSRLCKELGLPSYKSSDGLTMLQLEKEIRSKVDGLTKEKNDRLKHLRQLTKMDEQLCARLAMAPHYVPSGMVPSTQQLAELEEHIRGLEAEQMRRQKNFTGMQEKIVQMLEDLELSPNTSFERNVVCDLETVPLTSDNLKAAKNYHDELDVLLCENKGILSDLWDKVKSLWERLSLPREHRIEFEDQHASYSHRTILALKEELVRCERLKLQNIQQIIEATRKELVSWWDRCFILPDTRASFRPFYEEKMSEELLLVHEAEIEAMRAYYRQNQEMLEKVAKRQQLWEELLDLEHKANNPDRFLNRGCNLLKEEKARKKLAFELPKIEHEVSLQIRNWEKVTGKPFLLCGMPFEEYIRKQRDDFIAEKENERLQRQQQKARQMEEEIMYGSKPVTPGTKRFAGHTPTKTPNKCRKMETTPCKVGLSTHKSRTNMAANLASPVCLPPRHKDRPALSKAVSSPSIDRLTEHNRASSCQTLNANMALAGMTVVASSIGITSSDPDLSSMSLLSVGLYDDFANGLNRTSKPNIRSTLAPKGAYF